MAVGQRVRIGLERTCRNRILTQAQLIMPPSHATMSIN